jgi:hypothetical protein
MTQVLDVRGGATLKQIRAMAGRAFLDGPHDYVVGQLVGPLLDLAVSKAEGIKAVIHLVDNPVGPFYECCVLNECGRLQHQYIPSRMWSQGGPIIETNSIELMPTYAEESSANPCGEWAATAHGPHLHFGNGPTPLVAAMRAYVCSKLGTTVRM